MGLLERVLNWGSADASQSSERSQFSFNGMQYPYGFMPSTTYGNDKQEPPDPSFVGYASMLYKLNPVLLACALVRLNLFSEARFQYRRLRSGRPGDLFGDANLSVLETPWPNGTTGDLLARAIQDSDIAGNAYFARRGQFLRRMRPDWVTIVLGSEQEQEKALEDLDAQVLGYLYQPGGAGSGMEPVALLPEQVCHFAPIPDPVARFRGMSWLTSIINELMADNAATSHKLKYFEQGATPNMKVLIGGPLAKTQEQFDMYAEKFRRGHEGNTNAFKTVFYGEGMDILPIGANMQEITFKEIQGAGETRIAAAARTPAVIVGLSEGMQGSSLNAGNYDAAFRGFADLTMRPLWRNFAGSIAPLVNVPSDAELWYDDRDIPALQEDIKDAAEVQEAESRTIKALVEAGFEPDSVVQSVVAGDLKQLKHTGKTSVQLQPPLDEPASSNGVPTVPIGAASE
jgi:phage portal protein BeeE